MRLYSHRPSGLRHRTRILSASSDEQPAATQTAATKQRKKVQDVIVVMNISQTPASGPWRCPVARSQAVLGGRAVQSISRRALVSPDPRQGRPYTIAVRSAGQRLLPDRPP